MSLNCEFIPIEWIEPTSNESIIYYSKRLSKVINTSEKFCVLGVSFGGLIAMEISKLLKPELTILISSVETKNQLRLLFRWFGKNAVSWVFANKTF